MRNFYDLEDLAIEKHIHDLLPVVELNPSDIALAHLATTYATENFYTPSYIREKI